MKRADDDQAIHLTAVDLDEPPGGHVQIGERLGMGDVRERAVEAVGPAVVGAHQRVGAAWPFDQRHPAVTARVTEHPRPTVAVAHREQRHAEGDTFGVVAGVGDRRRRKVHARIRAQNLQLIGESGWVQVVLDRLAPRVAFIGRARVDVRKDAANDLDILGDRRPCRSAHTVGVSHYERHASTTL